jgi:hypothetical protein
VDDPCEQQGGDDPCAEEETRTPPGVTVQQDGCNVTITVQVKCDCQGAPKGSGIIGPPDPDPTSPPSPDIAFNPIAADSGTLSVIQLNMNGISPWSTQYKWEKDFAALTGTKANPLVAWMTATQDGNLSGGKFTGFALVNLQGLSGAYVRLSTKTASVYRSVSTATSWGAKVDTPTSTRAADGRLTVSARVTYATAEATTTPHYLVVMPEKVVSGGTTDWTAYQNQGGRAGVTSNTNPTSVVVSKPPAPGSRMYAFVVRSAVDPFATGMAATPVSAPVAFTAT